LRINNKKELGMDDRDHDASRDITSELKTALPFMSEFPFGDYEITMVESGDDSLALGVSPLLIKEIGDHSKIESINFYYSDELSNISISLYRGDVEWIAETAHLVKKLDAFRKELDDALVSDNLIDKIKVIKSGRKFSKLIDCENVTGLDFGELLSNFLIIHDTVLHSKIKLGLQKLSDATLKSTEFSERQFKAVKAFLNFQIHYIKILLGIVIAAKIY
jgi:hypothetical protein